jgi:hypothetical protein
MFLAGIRQLSKVCFDDIRQVALSDPTELRSGNDIAHLGFVQS